MIFEIIFFSIIVIALAMALGITYRKYEYYKDMARVQSQLTKDTEETYRTLLHQKKSSEIRTGQIAETMLPFLKEFPYDPKQAHFLGNPIDYIVFRDEEVVFVEVKSGKSRLTNIQRHIKELILDGKVKWKEIRVE
jgi:predicted Holliday junction resolvase-like endonuclease